MESILGNIQIDETPTPETKEQKSASDLKKCGDCGKCFASNKSLSQHRSQVHGESKYWYVGLRYLVC